jgi:hypothetical protein
MIRAARPISHLKSEILNFHLFSALRFSLALLILCLLASSSFAGTVTGTVHNGTTGQLAAGVDVILIQLQGGMQPVANTKTDAKGHFEFNNPNLGAAPMLLRAQYRGVNYHEPIPPGKSTVEIQVFEPTDKPGSFSIAAHAVILQTNGSDLMVGEQYSILNNTRPPVAFYRADGSFVFSLPEGAQLNDVSAAGASGMPVVQGTIDKGKGLTAIAFPFRPGESEVRISYKLPYSGNHTTLHFSSPYAAERFAIFAPPPVQISGGGLSPAGADQGFNVYMRQSLPAETQLAVSVSGTAPMAASNQGGGATGGAAAGDDSGNPSVNSRADSSGGDAPTATATSMPARLDSLKWILVSGFAAIFVLGLAYLWRRPQIVTAGPTADALGPVSDARPARARSNFQSAAVAEVDREVRGRLDELKDNLFRLELRRQAGTIGEDDYARERQRLEEVLRDLVRG